ncbi:heterokaryon incompatibility protein-domain-containing protein [Lophiotrema nucula]|uniref:Heterokaryon incompatibility protein-domain-containing protein n=1 Tax=Lophiotrema nucula TaxID=690887 RepID=A0A6A5ZSG1_9PLEO|nr:heterokaryon incompatibility protein-domain-containing protein [Lophiotrema nucula]
MAYPDRAEGLPAPKRRKISSNPSLCDACQLLDMPRKFRRANRFYELARDGEVERNPRLLGGKVGGPTYYKDCFLAYRFGSHLNTPSDCSLCNFFRSVMIQPGKHERSKLLGFCSSDSSLFYLPKLRQSAVWSKSEVSTFMAVVPDIDDLPGQGHETHWLEEDIPAVGSIFLLPPTGTNDTTTLMAARGLRDKADISLVEEWLTFCTTHHSACARSASYDPVEKWFRVINCQRDPPVVEEKAWGITYVALSYVWGNNTTEQWPKTVKDAVNITKELGLDYLWVDRLCITQSPGAEQDYLVSKMTTIYSEAHLTIIAAAGLDADHGLPGANGTPRRPQPKYNLDDGSTLVSSLPDPRLEVVQPLWSSRGWTYQEGILSRRRLIFTETQMYWECRCMAVNESINVPLHLVHKPSLSRMANFMLGGIFMETSFTGAATKNSEKAYIEDHTATLKYGFPEQDDTSVKAKLRGLQEHIRAFSARSLTKEQDSLRAFLGIVGLYAPYGEIYPFLGIPIWLGPVAGRPHGAQISLALSLASWYHRTGADFSMFASEGACRRYHLPSWTWAGWQGTVSWRTPPNDEYATLLRGLIEVPALKFLWAADLYLRDEATSTSMRLADVQSATVFRNDSLTLIEIRDALVLNDFQSFPITKEWRWLSHVGRQGREQSRVGADWDSGWHRLSRSKRLVVITISEVLTRQEWTARHMIGEFVSVLFFAAQDTDVEHGRLKFLTLRKVRPRNGEARWERIGTVAILVPDGMICRKLKGGDTKYRSTEEIFRIMPLKKLQGSMVIQ